MHGYEDEEAIERKVGIIGAIGLFQRVRSNHLWKKER